MDTPDPCKLLGSSDMGGQQGARDLVEVFPMMGHPGGPGVFPTRGDASPSAFRGALFMFGKKRFVVQKKKPNEWDFPLNWKAEGQVREGWLGSCFEALRR